MRITRSGQKRERTRVDHGFGLADLLLLLLVMNLEDLVHGLLEAPLIERILKRTRPIELEIRIRAIGAAVRHMRGHALE